MQKPDSQSGMTLIELMISMVIGLFLILGAVTVYSQGQKNYQANEGIARLQENMRFALDLLEPDIRLAGFWGMHSNPGAINLTGINVTCDGNDVTDWALNPLGGGPVGFAVIDDIQPVDADEVADQCSAFDDSIMVDTDILEIRRATGQPAGLNPGQVQIQTTVYGAQAFTDGAVPPDYTTVDPTWMNTFGVVLNSWYVATGSNAFDDVPSLRRRTLRGTQMVDEEVIPGVENMQIQLGIDTDPTPDGNVDRYVDPDDPLVATSPVIAVRLWLLMRATEAERGFVDGSTYTPLDQELGDITPNDNFRRVQVSKTIRLRNAVTG